MDAAKAEGVKHFVWSSLEDTRPALAPSRQPLDSKGRTVPHFDAKSEVEAYLREQVGPELGWHAAAGAPSRGGNTREEGSAEAGPAGPRRQTAAALLRRRRPASAHTLPPTSCACACPSWRRRHSVALLPPAASAPAAAHRLGPASIPLSSTRTCCQAPAWTPSPSQTAPSSSRSRARPRCVGCVG